MLRGVNRPLEEHVEYIFNFFKEKLKDDHNM
jgi:hypothetical protein